MNNKIIYSILVLSVFPLRFSAADETKVAAYCADDAKKLRAKYDVEHAAERGAQTVLAAEALKVKEFLTRSKAYAELKENHATMKKDFYRKKIGELLDVEIGKFFRSTDSEQRSLSVETFYVDGRDGRSQEGDVYISLSSSRLKLNRDAEKECKANAREDIKNVAERCKTDPNVRYYQWPEAKCMAHWTETFQGSISSGCHDQSLVTVASASLNLDPLSFAVIPQKNATGSTSFDDLLHKTLDADCFIATPVVDAENGLKRVPAARDNIPRAVHRDKGVIEAE